MAGLYSLNVTNYGQKLSSFMTVNKNILTHQPGSFLHRLSGRKKKQLAGLMSQERIREKRNVHLS